MAKSIAVYAACVVSSACGRIDFDALADAANSAARDAADDDDADNDEHTYRDAVLADAPLAYWRLDDADSTAHDEMARFDGRYEGTCVQGVAGALARSSSAAVLFDGVTCDVVIDATGLQFADRAPFSIEAWIAPVRGPQTYQFVFDEETRNSGPIDGYAIYIQQGASTLDASFERVTATYSDEPFLVPVPSGRFSHVVAVYDGASSRFYVDGMLAGAPWRNARSLAPVAVPAMIGNSEDAQHFYGAIDEVAVYDHVLSARRVAFHHEIGVGGPQ